MQHMDERMPSPAISLDLIDDVLCYIAGGRTVEEASRHFDIPVATVEAVIRWNVRASQDAIR